MTGTNGQNGQAPALKTVSQAARYLGISERTVRRYVKAGKLGTLDIDGQTRIQPADLDRLAAVTGLAPAVTGGIDRHVSDPTAEALRDTIRRQDKLIERQEEDIRFLRTELTATGERLETALRMLPANTQPPESPQAEPKPQPLLHTVLFWTVIVFTVAALALWVFYPKTTPTPAPEAQPGILKQWSPPATAPNSQPVELTLK